MTLRSAIESVESDTRWPRLSQQWAALSRWMAAHPSIEAVKSAAWRDDPALSNLIGKLALRRVPIKEAETAIRAFAAQAGAEKSAKLLALFAGLFEAMANERGQVVAGLDRFGRRQKELADAIRAETAWS